MRILVRLPNWVGDGVMAAPAVLALAASRAEWQWHLLGNARSRPLFEGCEAPFTLLPMLPAGASRLDRFVGITRQLRSVRYDAALVLPPSFSSAAMAFFGGARVRVGWSTEGRGLFLNSVRSGPLRDRLLREQYLELGRLFLRRVDPAGPALSDSTTATRLPLKGEEIVAADEWWAAWRWPAEATLALAPGATYGPTKRWPEDRFVQLGCRLREEGQALIWIGGPEEVALCRRLAEATLQGSRNGDRAGRPPSVSTAGTLSLRETMSILARARATVSNDSGAMHLAQAVGCPVVGIFGSTSPRWTGPVGDLAAVVYRAVPCSPCFARTCPTAIECLTGISVADVEHVLRNLLARARGYRGRPAVFLDRDGPVLASVDYLREVGDVRLAPGAADGLRRLARRGFALVIVTNQSAVARGLLTRDGLEAIHREMRRRLREEGIELDGIEACPHHPDFTGPCACRKPAPGMLRRAAHRLDLDLERSYFVGDSSTDLQAATRAGVRPILVRQGYGRETEAQDSSDGVAPAFVGDDLAEAAAWIVDTSEEMPSSR